MKAKEKKKKKKENYISLFGWREYRRNNRLRKKKNFSHFLFYKGGRKYYLASQPHKNMVKMERVCFFFYILNLICYLLLFYIKKFPLYSLLEPNNQDNFIYFFLSFFFHILSNQRSKRRNTTNINALGSRPNKLD